MPGPEELGRKRRHEGRDADLGDDHAVDEADENSGGQARDDREPAKIVFLEQDGENEAGKGDDRRKAEVDFAGPDDKGQTHGEQDRAAATSTGRSCRYRALRKTSGAPYMNKREQQREDDDDRQRLEALQDRCAGLL